MTTQKITLPIGIATSIQERSQIQAAVSNIKTATKYINEWIKNCKNDTTNSNLSCLDYSLTWSIKYKNDFLSTESMANKYKELWAEKYYKAKHFYEKSAQEAESILSKNKFNQ